MALLDKLVSTLWLIQEWLPTTPTRSSAPAVSFNPSCFDEATRATGLTKHGAGFGETTDYDSLVNSNCTSCIATEDKSAYWTPIPYFKNDATGEYEAVGNVGGMLA